MINVVNKYKHTPGPNDFYIGRGSALGNPFTSIKDRKTKAEFVCESREESVEAFREYLTDNIAVKNPEITNALNKIWLKAKKGDLNLVCYCKPKSCHGDVSKEFVEEKLKNLP